jgi:hypothetical protein
MPQFFSTRHGAVFSVAHVFSGAAGQAPSRMDAMASVQLFLQEIVHPFTVSFFTLQLFENPGLPGMGIVDFQPCRVVKYAILKK